MGILKKKQWRQRFACVQTGPLAKANLNPNRANTNKDQFTRGTGSSLPLTPAVLH